MKILKTLVFFSAACCSLISPCEAQNKGKWSQVYNTPLIAAAAANLPDGRVLIWSANARTSFTGGNGQTFVGFFNPNNGNSTSALIKNTNHDMFCPGTATLADGRIMIAGGSNAEAVTFYDPRSNRWTRGQDMKIPRGYHANTVLDDGTVFTVGGSWSGGRGGKVGELWHPANRQWRTTQNIEANDMKTNDRRGIYRSDNHMWLFQAPDSRIFHAGPSKQMHWLSPKTGNGVLKRSVRRGSDPDAMNGGAVMIDKGKILTIGGCPHYDGQGMASRNTHIIDINGREARVTKVGNLNKARTLISPVVLPSGAVVVFGGQPTRKW